MAAWVRGLVGTLALLALAQVAGVSDGLNRWLTDAHWRWQAAARRAPFPPDVVVVAVDDLTLQEKGRLGEWSRTEYVPLLERLALAKAVGIDILFTEPDGHGGDGPLAAAMRRHGRVVIPWHSASKLSVSARTEAARQALLSRLPYGQGESVEALPVTRYLNLPLPGEKTGEKK